MTLREAVEVYLSEKKHKKQIEFPPDYAKCIDPIKFEGTFSNGCAWFIGQDDVCYMKKQKKDRRGIIHETWFELY